MGFIKAVGAAFVIWVFASWYNLTLNASDVFLGACIIAAGFVAYTDGRR